jgi:hypothetical protein
MKKGNGFEPGMKKVERGIMAPKNAVHGMRKGIFAMNR